MADIKGIELASDIYGLEDETARDNTETNTSAIGTLADLQTTAKTNLVAAINEIETQANGRRNLRTISFKNGFTKSIGEVVYYISGIRALIFYVGGIRDSEIVAGETAFTLSVSENFHFGGYGFVLPIIYRSRGSGATAIGSMLLLKSGNTITAEFLTVPSGTWEEFRLMGNVLLSL